MMLVFLCLTLLMGMSESVNGLEELLETKQIQAAICNSTNTRCGKFGGKCFSGNVSPVRCDYKHQYMCQKNDNCTCCIDCERSRCASQRGQCRYCECGANEYHDNTNPCPYRGCLCCRRCDTARECINGMCVRQVEKYVANGYVVNVNVRCPQPECTCVQSCYDVDCMAAGGKCMRNQESNNCDLRENVIFKCPCGKDCFCCVKRRTPITG